MITSIYSKNFDEVGGDEYHFTKFSVKSRTCMGRLPYFLNVFTNTFHIMAQLTMKKSTRSRSLFTGVKIKSEMHSCHEVNQYKYSSHK